jgi:hypothetical protein
MKTRKKLNHRKKKHTYKLKQRGGLLGHVTGFHLSERGIRRILTGNHRVKKRYTNDLRNKCYEHILYHPKIGYSDKNLEEVYKLMKKDVPPSTDDRTLVCGLHGPILKYSAYRPDGTTYVAEGYQNIMKEYESKIKH